MIVTNGSTAPLLGGSDRPTSIRSSDIHSNRNDNYTSSSGSAAAARKRSSLGILLFLTILSAIVTYLYDAVLAPYNMSEAGSPSSISSLNSMATSNDIDYSRELPEEDVGGYVPSLEQRSVARTMNLEQRVSTIPIIRYMSCFLAPCVMICNQSLSHTYLYLYHLYLYHVMM